MTAGQWLQEENLRDVYIPSIEGAEKIQFLPIYRISAIMERYTTDKTANLQALILSFRQRLLKDFLYKGTYINLGGLLEEFDTHFEIEKLQQGETNGTEQQ